MRSVASAARQLADVVVAVGEVVVRTWASAEFSCSKIAMLSSSSSSPRLSPFIARQVPPALRSWREHRRGRARPPSRAPRRRTSRRILTVRQPVEPEQAGVDACLDGETGRPSASSAVRSWLASTSSPRPRARTLGTNDLRYRRPRLVTHGEQSIPRGRDSFSSQISARTAPLPARVAAAAARDRPRATARAHARSRGRRRRTR